MVRGLGDTEGLGERSRGYCKGSMRDKEAMVMGVRGLGDTGRGMVRV